MVLQNMLRVFFLFSLVWLSQQKSTDVQLVQVYGWTFADFAYASTEQRSQAIQNGQFIPNNIAILDSSYYDDPNSQKRRFFVSMPSLRLEGYPAALAEVIVDETSNAALLQPFPSWQANDKSSCNGLISVYRTQIDKCGNLWVVDAGTRNTFVSTEYVCPPKLIIYNLNNQDSSEEVVRYEFNEQRKSNSLLINLVIESTAEDCSDAIAYIADVRGFGIIVYNKAQNDSWRVEHNSMIANREYATVTTNGVTFTLMDGIFGLALGPAAYNSMKLYYHCFASLAESSVSTAILKDMNAIADIQLLNNEIQTSEPVREGPSTVQVVTADGILIYALVRRNALVCWNIAMPFTKENQHIIFEDDNNFQFIAGMKLYDKSLLIISTMLQKYIDGTMVEDEIKYRILYIENVDDLLKDTPCKF